MTMTWFANRGHCGFLSTAVVAVLIISQCLLSVTSIPNDSLTSTAPQSNRLPPSRAAHGFLLFGSQPGASVQVDVFVDLLCPYSRTAFHTMRKLSKTYRPTELSINLHLFPLPFHHQSYITASSTFAILRLLGQPRGEDRQKAVEQWFETVFENQESYLNQVTENKGQKQVTEELGELAMSVFPSIDKASWTGEMPGHGGTAADAAMRSEYKYGAYRGVRGTPFIYVNDILDTDLSSQTTTEEWQKLIDHALADG